MTILSAGSEPADAVHPVVVEALAELGLQPDSQPKPLDPAQVKTSDWVVTMGCGEACPFFPGVHYQDWKIDDPSGRSLEEVRGIIGQIRTHVRSCSTRSPKANPPYIPLVTKRLGATGEAPGATFLLCSHGFRGSSLSRVEIMKSSW
ncbi:arsenate reductase [Bifidobacterium pseudolongum subsp. pseudolongum]|nr:arsenate reductase [Bifidobacterium pseudolongum subsp. pseudolongum]